MDCMMGMGVGGSGSLGILSYPFKISKKIKYIIINLYPSVSVYNQYIYIYTYITI